MRIRGRNVDALVYLSFVLGAVYILGRLWMDPNGRYLTLNFQDSFNFEWILTHATELFTKGESPFFSDDVNYPLGVNLMANTSILTLALPLTPITLWLGPGVTFVIISTLALAGTACAWYYVLSRHFGRSKLAAFVGAAFLGFAPAMMSHIAGHPNIAGQYFIPLIIAVVFRMKEPGNTWRQGIWLAVLVVLQAGINEEMLFFTAMALAVFILAYVPWRDLLGYAKVMAPKCGVTLLVAGVVLAYPLYFQFTGPQHYSGLDAGVRAINLDAKSYVAFGRYSIAGDVAEASRLNKGNASEENSFFGWPLILVMLAGTIFLWRSRLSRALAITGVVFAICSLGDVIRVDGVDRTNFHGPWKWISALPLFDSVVPTRLALITTVCIGVGLALMVDKLVVERLRPVAADAPAATAVPPREPEPALVGGSSSGGDSATAAGDSSASTGGSSVPAYAGDSSASTASAGAASTSTMSIGAPSTSTDDPAAATGDGRDGSGLDSSGRDVSGRSFGRSDQTQPPVRPVRGAGPVPSRSPRLALVWAVALLVALVPLFPTPQPADGRPPIPALFTNGNWRTKLPPHPVVAPLPGGWDDNIKMMRWSTETNFEVKLTGGYFLGPNDTEPDDKYAHFGPGYRDTVIYLNGVLRMRTSPTPTEEQRADFRADIRHWKATNLVMPVGYYNEKVLRETIDKLVSPDAPPAQIVDGVYLWDVRSITANP
ncbi:DUF6541 family protein [Dactylosporangium sp. NPDC051541]|uniref:DUF6541 family protein n=1 Tax=Dactylosporangium sp. NPDC051541 TaxID=3363977 RepID=UPI0037B04203